MTDVAWLIEAPGASYLEAHELGGWYFGWSHNPNRALRFISHEQANAVMMAVRESDPALFAFEATLGNARPVEHGWLLAREQVERLARLLDALGQADVERPEGDHMNAPMQAEWLLARGVTVGAPSDRTVTEAVSWCHCTVPLRTSEGTCDRCGYFVHVEPRAEGQS